MNILVVEDNPQRLRSFGRNLIGARVFAASTETTAKSTMMSYFFDVIFLDHDLHEHGTPLDVAGSGMGVVAEIERRAAAARAKQSNPTLPMVIVHSLNPERAAAMVQRLKRSRIRTYQRASAWNDEGYLAELVHTGWWRAPHREPQDTSAPKSIST